MHLLNSLRNWVIFFAGAEFLHTVSNVFSPQAMIIHGAITTALLWWAYNLKENPQL